jgi:hypothetical protein
MDREELKKRTKQFALRVMKLVDALPNTAVGRAIGGQLVRARTSVGANYRSACRGRSTAEFVAGSAFLTGGRREAPQRAVAARLATEDHGGVSGEIRRGRPRKHNAGDAVLSVAAADSRREVRPKLGTAEEEADEGAYWLELTIEGRLLPAERVEPLLQEANELTAIMSSSRKTAKKGAVRPGPRTGKSKIGNRRSKIPEGGLA